MTSDGEALLRAICESPWEDTPRLVYADWLEENGQPERAELIRVQIEMTRLPRNKQFGSPQYDRAFELELKWDPTERAIAGKAAKRPKRSWSADLPVCEGVEWQPFYNRGFRNAVIFSSMKAVRAHAAAVMAASPVDNVSVKRMNPPAVAELLAQPWVPRLTALHLSGLVSTLGAETIGRSGALGRLEWLDLANSQMTDAGLKALAASTALPSLTRLGLEGNTSGVTEAGLNELMKSKTLKKLTAVDGVQFTLIPATNPLGISVKFNKRFPHSR